MKTPRPNTTTIQATHMDDYRTIKNCINEEYAINSPQGVFSSDHLWMFPENWIKGFADFIRTSVENKLPKGFILGNVFHDIKGYVNKEVGFSPRCFKGGSVWDIKGKQPQKTIH